MNSLSSKVITNFIWRFAEHCGAQVVAFVVTIVIARIVTPEEYGVVALIMVMTQLLNVFVDSGLGNAIIQKKEVDDCDYSTVFFINIIFCLSIYVLLFLFSPIIAGFYANPAMTPMIRVAGIVVIVSGVKNIQQAYVSRNMLFKKFFFSTLGGTLCSAVVGIAMAYAGFGVWALIAQGLVNPVIDTIILWCTVKWRPKLMFSFQRLKSLWSYGWKLLLSALLDTGFTNLKQIIIGKKYTTGDLAYYNKGDQFPMVLITNINASIDSVMFPVLSGVQDEKESLRFMTRRSIKMSIYIIAPLMVGMIVVANPMIHVLLTDKWLPSVPYLRIFCVMYMYWPLHTANLNAMKAAGRSDLFLKLEIIKKTMGVGVVLITMWYGPMVMAASCIVTDAICFLINAWPNSKLMGYHWFEQVKDILPYIIMSIIMGLVIWPLHFLVVPELVKLIIQVIAGIVVYAAGSRIMKFEDFNILMDFMKSFLGKKK